MLKLNSTNYFYFILFLLRKNPLLHYSYSIIKQSIMTKLLIILALVGGSCCASAQMRTITLDEMFAIADTVESSLCASKLKADAAAELVGDSKKGRLPDINTSLTVGYLGDGYIWDRDFSDGMAVDIPHFRTNFAIEIKQVIYAGGTVKKAVTFAQKGHEMADIDYQLNRQQVRFSLVGSYLNLYKAINQIEVYDQNIVLVEKLIEHLNEKKEQGTVLRNALTRYELQHKNLKLQRQKLENTMLIFNHQLVTSLKLNPETKIFPDTTLISNIIDIGSEQDWQQLALNSSPILQEAKVEVELAELQKDMLYTSYRPVVALVAQDHLDAPITIDIPAKDKNFNYWFVGVALSYNISSLYKSNNKIRSAKIGVEQSNEHLTVAKQQINNAIQESFIRLGEAYNEVEVQTANLELARQNYEVTNNRYINDLALMTDMLDASNAMLTAQLDLKNAQINLLFSYLKLKYLCGQI